MAISAKTGTFAINTALTAGQDQAITGVGFQGKAAIFWWSGATSATDATAGGSAKFGCGFATSSSNRYCQANMDTDAQATTDTANTWRNDAAIAVFGATVGAVDGLADFKSFDADGFTLTIDDQFGTAYIISYMILGGTDLTNVIAGTSTSKTSTGTLAVTGLGFKPDFMLFSFCGSTAVNNIAAQGYSNLGFTRASGANNNYVAFSSHRDAGASSDTFRYLYNGECLVLVGTDVAYRATLTSFDDDGFTLNWLESTAARNYIYLALKGGTYTTGDLLTQTDTTTTVTETVAGTARGIMMISHNTAVSAQDTADAHASLSVGAADSASSRNAQGIWSEDNTADSETATSIEYDGIYTRIAADDSLEGVGDITEITTTGFTFKMDDADTNQAYVAWWAVSDAATSGLLRHPGMTGFIEGGRMHPGMTGGISG